MHRGSLNDRLAIVTGSDSGIGRATAIEFAKEGADVVITCHSDTKGVKETAAEVEKQGRQAIVITDLDQQDSDDVKRVFKQTHEKLDRPATILVNNAGTDSTGKSVKDMGEKDWDAEIRTNLYGPFYFCKYFIQQLDGKGERKNGTIINITSVHDEAPRAGASGYCSAKAGLNMLTKCLALELAQKGVTVNNIAPGMVLTPFNQAAVMIQK